MALKYLPDNEIKKILSRERCIYAIIDRIEVGV